MIVNVISQELRDKLKPELEKIFEFSLETIRNNKNIFALPYPVNVTLDSWEEEIVKTNIIKKSIEKYKKLNGVYVICVKNKNDSKWIFKYIGQKCSNSESRFIHHFVKKPESKSKSEFKVGAMIDKVKIEASSGNTVGIIFLATTPYYLRHSIEEYILQTSGMKFEWNGRSKKKIAENSPHLN